MAEIKPGTSRTSQALGTEANHWTTATVQVLMILDKFLGKKMSFNSTSDFQSLGLARTAEVQRDARIGEAKAQMDTVIKQAIASEELLKSKLLNDTEIAR